MVRNNFNLRKFIKTCLEMCVLILAKSFPTSIKISDHTSRLVLGPVLLLFLLTSIHFCNLILDDKTKKIPDKIIDSWDDLALWKDVSIFGLQNRFMSKFIDQNNSMARNFKERFNEIPIDNWLSKQFCIDMAKNISTGSAVLVINKLTLIFTLMRMAKYVKDEDPDFLDHVHVSKDGSTDLPYFIPSFNEFHHPYHQDLNKV